MSYTSNLEAVNDFHMWTAISSVAGALRRKVWFNHAQVQWSPNFYIILVAPPAIATKSTTVGIGMSLLRELDTIPFGPNALTWQYLPKALADSLLEMPLPDGTLYPMCALTFEIAELGTFLDTKQRELIDVLTDLWDAKAGPWVKATKGSGTDNLVNPWINILACTTPTWLRTNLSKDSIGGGFASRCIFVYSNSKRQIVAYPSKTFSSEQKSLRQDLVRDLAEIAMLAGEFTLTPEAMEYGTQWYHDHITKLQKMSDEGEMAYAGRLQCQIHKLAMVLSAAQRSNLVIDVPELQAAVTIMTNVMNQVPRILRIVDTVEGARQVFDIRDLLQRSGPITKTDLFKLILHKFNGTVSFDDAINGALAAGYIQLVQDGPTVWIKPLVQDPQK